MSTRSKKIVKFAKSGMPVLAIAKKLDVHLSTVYVVLREAGVKPRSSRDGAPLASRKRVLSLVAKVGVAKASRELGVSRQAIYLRFQRWRDAGLLGSGNDWRDTGS